MKIKQLFDELEKIKVNTKSDFEKSGMVNRFDEMKYGFFPLGLGILTENNKIKDASPTDEIEEGGVMVLGNDFGTVTYVNDVIKYSGGLGEIKSSTIINMLKFIPELKADNIFFTNFYQGIRLDDGRYTGTTMTKRMYDCKPNKVKDEYKKLCNEFFKIQLGFVKPRIVVCLGHEVKNALIDLAVSFHQWKPKTDSLEKLYAKEGNKYIIKNTELNGIKFIVIPHPSYPVNLVKPPYLKKLNGFLESN
jgi:hypothetical protein